jgi:ABC-2 type transport system ATP-binding protein
MPSIISVQNLVKRYHKAKDNAVNDVSFDVKPGEFFTLLGPNGAGKTTIISILNTTLNKTQGTVAVAGFNIDRQQSQGRRQIGVIFQNPSLDTNLTAEENVRFHAVLYGLYPYRPSYSLMPQDYKKDVARLAEIVGLSDNIHQPIKTFSGGMKRKLEIVRSLIHQPRVLFLDEPSTGLDPLSRRNLWAYLKDVRRQRQTTLFLTTHYLEEAEDSDRVCVIDHGQVISLGTPAEIKHKLVNTYLLLETTKPQLLTQELTQLNIPFRHDRVFHLEVSESQIPSLLRRLKTELTSIKIHSPTLEEAYLKIITDDQS